VRTRELNSSNAILVQVLLSLDRKDLAQTTYQNVKKFGNDSLLVQAMEAWIGLKTVRPPSLHMRKLSYSLVVVSHQRLTIGS
jgi:coatomer protein complex subunit epsilon